MGSSETMYGESEFVKEMGLFREAAQRFGRAEITRKEYKGISGRYGSYAQKGDCCMLRLRIPGGALSKENLEFIAGCVEEHHIDMVHLTTCQSVQLHNLELQTACDIAESAFARGIHTLGGGGDYPRNITASPLTGVEPGVHGDVLPYAKAAESYLMGIFGRTSLPRKMKIGFSDSNRNAAHATFRDLGFVCDSGGTFDVYIAGGLGKDPRMGLKAAQGIDPGDVLYHIRAMTGVFETHGDRSDRSRARTRYMQDSLGKERLLRAYREHLEEAKAAGGLGISTEASSECKAGEGRAPSHPRVHAQRQPGLYYVSYHPIGGDPPPSKLGEIYDTIADMDGAEVRIAPYGTVYVINCTSGEALRVADSTEGGAETVFQSSVSCVGSSICQIGQGDSRSLLDELVDMERRRGFCDGVLPRVRISGCTSSCGAHQVGSLGFRGATKRIGGRPFPGFEVFVNGSHVRGEERFGISLGVMLDFDVPLFLGDLGDVVSAAGTTYDLWNPSHGPDLEAIARVYTEKT